MSALWLVPAAVLLVGMIFLVRSVARVGKAVKELTRSMGELSQANAALQDLREDVAQLGEAARDRPAE